MYMLEIETAANWIAITANVAIAVYILARVHRLSGLLLVAWFTVLAIQFVLLTETSEIIKFEMVNGEAILIAPLWYKIFIAARSLLALLSPVALYLLATQALASKDRKNA